MSNQVLALADCNNFFVSCERVFNPKLRNVPVVVLTGNDGCIVARSNEAKALGIKMGEPYFKCKDFLAQNNVKVFSSNFTLYTDISHRVMDTLDSFSPEVEHYSVDESFLNLSEIPKEELNKYGLNIRRAVLQNIGIPVSIGIASTKTLCKIAAEIAKKDKDMNGVLDFVNISDDQMNKFLNNIEIEDVWGVGRNISRKLRRLNINSALDLKYADPKWMKRHFTVMGERLVMELNGVSCILIDQVRVAHKSIISTRSFGVEVTTLKELEEAVTMHISNVCETLRKDKLCTNMLTVYIRTSHFTKSEPYFSKSATVSLPFYTSFTPDLNKYAIKALASIFQSGKKYKKCGVFLYNLMSMKNKQISLFEKEQDEKDDFKANIMQNIDKINKVWGSGTVRLASQGFEHHWHNKRDMLSPAYTTRWEDLLKVRI